MRDERFLLPREIKHDIVAHTRHIFYRINTYPPQFTIYTYKDRIEFGYRLIRVSSHREPLFCFVHGSHELVITDRFKQKVKSVDFITVEGVILECRREDHT